METGLGGVGGGQGSFREDVIFKMRPNVVEPGRWEILM